MILYVDHLKGLILSLILSIQIDFTQSFEFLSTFLEL